MEKVYRESLALHKKYRGKIGIFNKVQLKNKEVLSLAYTPGVAEISRAIHKNTNDVYKYTNKWNSVAIVTDGSAILGLGNLGPLSALPVMEGKAAIFKEFAKIDAFPICLKTQNTNEIISIIENICPSFGAICLEDISAPRCFEIEKTLRNKLPIPIMHDDQHGTSTIVLAALINALKLVKKDNLNIKIVINGSGAAGIAVTKLLLYTGFKNIILLDSNGAIFKGRPDLNKIKKDISNLTNLSHIRGDLTDAIIGADVFIGLSKGNILNKKMIKSMANKPIIFALANPVPEIMPNEAKEARAFIIATGRSDFPNQINNSLAFPGLFRGALDNHIKQFTQDIFVKAAYALSNCIKPNPNQLLPKMFDKRIVKTIARVTN